MERVRTGKELIGIRLPEYQIDKIHDFIADRKYRPDPPESVSQVFEVMLDYFWDDFVEKWDADSPNVTNWNERR